MTGTHDVATQVRVAADAGTALRIEGRGTWLGANRPVRANATLSLADCAGIVDYVPGDLTLTARAGTPLTEIAHAAREHGQWLALDPYGGDGGSIGATVATASYGPHAATFGTPRNHVLGFEFVTGAGDIVRGGGRVVKNVAGFDLVRLGTGAWGTLGVITEVTVRLRALPNAHETVVAAWPDGDASEAWCAALRRLATAPYACELVNGSLAARLGLPARPMLIVRVAGNRESVRAQRDALAHLEPGGFDAINDDIWTKLRAGSAAQDAVWRLSRGPAQFASTWREAVIATSAFDGAQLHGSPLSGVARCVVSPVADQADDLAALDKAITQPFDGTRVGEQLPANAWSAFPSAVTDRLSRGIRAAFDPRGILNPGIMGDAA
ncbi:MAG TPA: FAD-binding oxidoreductase [Gemmatimonadaceae bacterium]